MAATDADPEQSYVEHPLLAEGFLEDRRYQSELVETAVGDHTLVCLPTGLGKTTVSLRVTAERLRDDVGAKSLLLAPTKPLVEQHAAFYREALQIPDDEIVVFTGDVRPDDRAELWGSARVVIATPQVVENDLVGGRIDLRDVVHVTFDECHRASGDYAYVYIAERYHADAADPLVTGMSASPGGDEEEILSVCANLGVSEVAVMTEDDADVADYTHDTDVEWERIELPDAVLEIRDSLNDVITERLEALKELGVTRSTQPDMSQKDLNRMRGKLRELIDNDQSEGYEGMSLHAEVMKLRRAVELVETQSVESVRRYFERQKNAARSSGASKASQRLVSEPRVKEAMRRAEAFDGLHPKFRRVRMLLAETLGIEGGERVIVFTESRDTAEALTEFLGNHFDARRFVGQGDKEGSDGMTQTEQGEVLDAFKSGEFEVLVSTSVAEEGLDVPEVDLVCFFEPVPTAIRSVQRKGRTGRQAEGRVVVLMAEDTRDEAFFWISRRREEEMEEELRSLQSLADDFADEFGGQETLAEYADGDAPASVATGGADGGDAAGVRSAADGQAGLTDFDDGAGETDDAGEEGGEANQKGTADGADADAGEASEEEGAVARADPPAEEDHVEVVVDQRELESTIARDLSKREHVETRLETLAVGDYVVSDRVALERKSVADFLDTLLGGDRDLFEQARDLARHYDRPVLILEGGDLYGARNVHPNAIRGALASLAVDYGLSVLRTEDEDDTADMLDVLAGREQLTRDREVSVHGEKSAKTLTEQQEYVVSSIADVGPVTARALLSHFGSVEAVMTADEETLLEADGVGEVTAERVREVVAGDYRP
ncbi:Fanconi anemia group M protein [Halarchaeum solikamskense]|uniref:DEAD/DEAH box helicase n=1 Tax=Halarchaeum nitratireducens TaxID=489913 RepID=UPI001B3A9DB8|nr:DEAD/DEAH box helicase [Halarchaeum solikamskense]MBP2252038.1 Fanconi anemia group M protein [Halarchaeum solikamskense]